MTSLQSPYLSTGRWLRGNLHAHTTASDGDRSPRTVIDAYASRGYDFLALSDHDTFVDPANYREETALTLLPAVEVSEGGPHLHHLGATRPVEPAEDRQSVLDAIENGELGILNHPRWLYEFNHWPDETVERLEGVDGVEIYNGLVEQHPGSALATDLWDRILSSGTRVWGFANDDSHGADEVERAWNVVQVETATPAAIMDALMTGRFYASTGVEITRIDVVDGRVTVETTNADRIRLISDHGIVQRTVEGDAATFDVKADLVHWGDDHSYVRLECLGRGGDTAWTQPMFIDE